MSDDMKKWWLAEIQKLKTPKECREFAKDMKRQGHEDMVPACWLREARLLPAQKGAQRPANDFELRVVRSIRVLERMRGRPLSRTWQLIARRGYIGTVEHLVLRKGPSPGFDMAVKYGLLGESFEQLALDYPKLFTKAARAAAHERLAGVYGQ